MGILCPAFKAFPLPVFSFEPQHGKSTEPLAGASVLHSVTAFPLCLCPNRTHLFFLSFCLVLLPRTATDVLLCPASRVLGLWANLPTLSSDLVFKACSNTLHKARPALLLWDHCSSLTRQFHVTLLHLISLDASPAISAIRTQNSPRERSWSKPQSFIDWKDR